MTSPATPPRGYPIVVAQLASVALHLAVLVGGGALLATRPEFAIDPGESSVEVELVAAPVGPIPDGADLEPIEPEPEPPVLPPQPEPEPEPPPPDPQPEPLPPPPPPEPEPEPEPVPEPVPVVPDPAPPPPPTPAKPAPPPAAPRPRPAPKPERSAAPRPARGGGDGSSAVPGRDASTSAAAGAIQAKPDYLRNPAPRYPDASRRAREEGLVLLQVIVMPNGKPQSVKLLRSSGFERLDNAALAAVRGWRFKPGRLGSTPVTSTVQVPVRFQLE